MTSTLTVHDFTARQLCETGKALIVLPMEPQPDSFVDGIPFRVSSGSEKGGPIDEEITVPHRVGDRVFISKQGDDPAMLLLADPSGDEAAEFTVTRVEAKMVREIDEQEAELAGCWSDTTPDCLSGFKAYWRTAHPAHPFDKAYAWLIEEKCS